MARCLNRDGYAAFDFSEPDFETLAEQIKRDVARKFNGFWSLGPSTTQIDVVSWETSNPAYRALIFPS